MSLHPWPVAVFAPHGGRVTASGQRVFIKQLPQAPEDLFRTEAIGLNAIAATDSIRVPFVYSAARSWLILEYIEPGQSNTQFWSQLGISIADLHKSEMTQFGFK